jgi:hypothetical protein
VKVRTRVLVLCGVAVALLLAGVVSYYASRSPDGLTKVAEDHGFSSAARHHDHSVFADYHTKGLGGGRLSGGLAGAAGTLVVLVLTGGLVAVVRRRKTSAQDS